ncbi:MAG: NAD(P)H-hydrate dehydratase [Campylobacteraceae bacterium]|nr:NAD(P)H-hydrate dehydratase [Campylobacteraceae bacterium]
MMVENAAFGMASYIREHQKEGLKVLILCGSGNNAADGYALARLLQCSYRVDIFELYPPKSELAKLQHKRAKSLNINFVDEIVDADIIVDALFGSGQKKEIDDRLKKLLLQVNSIKAFKIACDIPTGIFYEFGFKADVTLTMGALKEVLFEDFAKDLVGDIKCCNLGLKREFFEIKSDTFLLEEEDLKLPIRKDKNSNKGDFGYLSVIKGEQVGASTISALAGYSFGAGLVSLVGDVSEKCSPLIMQNRILSPKTTAIIGGMGLGNVKIKKEDFFCLPCVIDADLLYDEVIKEIVEKNENVVLTPHPKEFASLLDMFKVGSFSTNEIQQNRFELARKFSLACKAVLVLKGANTIIAKNGVLYVCNLGNSSLAKGGSGDVLAGFIGGLLAQNRDTLDASINAVLAHALISKKFKANNYSLTPYDLIEGAKWL